jgi:hypothetical protein
LTFKLLVAALALSAQFALADPVAARTLLVGPDEPFASPSAAARVAEDGDTVSIEPGDYYDCTVWTSNRLIIAGTAPGVVITDTTCQGKALFVVTGRDTTIHDLTLARARVPDGNGAGIRLEGKDLSLRRVRFANDQVSLLVGTSDAGAIRIADCRFEGGGVGGEHPTFAVLVEGRSLLLRIDGSIFTGVAGGQIITSAERTELVGNEIGTGTGAAPGLAVTSTHGHLIMEDNVLSLGPNEPALAAAVLVRGQDAPELRRNRLLNKTDRAAALVLDWTGGDPVLQGNEVGSGDVVLSTSGLWRHRAASLYHDAKDGFRSWAGQAERGLVELLSGR